MSDTKNPNTDLGDLSRSDFIKLLCGVLGGLGGFSTISGVEKLNSEGTHSLKLSDSYLIKGLTAMARAKGWFDAHWGAGIISGYYLCNDNDLSEETILGIKAQLDSVIKLRADQFKLFEEQKTDKKLIDDIPNALLPAMEGGLRSHGHAVIFSSICLRVLRDVPSLSQPTIIKNLCRIAQQIAKNKVKKPKTRKPYKNTHTMIEALFDHLAEFKDLIGTPFIRRPNFTHMTTHTEALMSLEELGYPELVKLGGLGHRAHLENPIPKIKELKSSPPKNSLKKIMEVKYWTNEENIKNWNQKFKFPGNPNGYWIAAGHLFKVLYSYHRLIKRVKDKDKVELCAQILLERYFNPEVKGG